ncbi:MAG: type IIA DNA topoisomerase subunit B [Christensenellaceae bacterium]
MGEENLKKQKGEAVLKDDYTSDKIKILEGLEPVRIRPGMYIGSTSEKGLHHILWEIVDNAIDEAANGFANRIEVVLYKDGSASVEDNGRGIPTDVHPTAKVSGVQVVFTQLHAGGKFDNENYSYSGGLHGVGASVTNALSEWLKVEVYNKYVYKMSFKSWTDKRGKHHAGIPNAPLEKTDEKTKKRGSFIRFKPDATIFETVVFDAETVSKRLKELAFLNKGVHIIFTDKRGDKDVAEEYKYDGGIVDFVKYLNEGKTCLYGEPIYAYEEKNGIKIEYSVQHTSTYTESIYSFVNNIPTPEGGMHEIGFKSGVTKAMNDIMREKGALKAKDANLLGEDFREGMTAIISIKLKNVEFEGQTKTKLGNPEVKPAVEAVTIAKYTEMSKNKKLADTLTKMMDKAVAAAKVRTATKQAKELARAKSVADGAKLVGKLSDCSSRKAELNELFIVEGDSAGGSAKQGRDRQHQAILPLRGKPLNAEKKSLKEVLENEEMCSLISALGTGLGTSFNIKGLRYDKVVILSDADQDGAHIRSILLAFFFRYMRELVQEGHVYIGMPPLYKVYKKDIVEYAYDDKELKSKIDKVGRGYQLQRYKGLGEMNPSQLWETTMNPQTRILMRVTLEDAALAERRINILVGDGLAERKQYIQKYADFNKEDNFEIRKND